MQTTGSAGCSRAGTGAGRQRTFLYEQPGVQTMKMVTAIVKPFKLDEVREALSGIGVQGRHGD
jgi:hypothetical protein